MDRNLTCNQVCSLLNFYIEGNLMPKLRQAVEQHLESCLACRKKVEELNRIFLGFKLVSPQEEKDDTLSGDFVNNLSAYIDNELNPNENVKIKKMAISNPAARKKLDSMYKFQKLMHSVYEKTRNNVKFDCSKQVISQIRNVETYSTTCFYKIALAFVALILAIIAGFLYLYF